MLIWWGWRPSNVKRLVNRPEWGSAPPLLPLRAVEVGVRPLAACTDVPAAAALLLTFPLIIPATDLLCCICRLSIFLGMRPLHLVRPLPRGWEPSKYQPVRISWAICCGVVILEAECTPCNRPGPTRKSLVVEVRVSCRPV